MLNLCRLINLNVYLVFFSSPHRQIDWITKEWVDGIHARCNVRKVMHQLLFLLQKMADNFFRKFIIDLSSIELRSLKIAYFLFLKFSIQRANLRMNASSFEIYSDEVLLGLWNDIKVVLNFKNVG